MTLFFISFSNLAFANIIYYKFYINQVFDVQRFPAFPTAFQAFTVSDLHRPLNGNRISYSLNNGEYIQLFYVGGKCNHGEVGINRFNAYGEYIETIQASGHIYGLSPLGFLHDNDNNIGTFIFTNPAIQDTYSYFPTTGPTAETCNNLAKY